MLTGELRSQIDSIWNDFWSGGIANPLEVIEQITYLLFISGLDELQTLEEHKADALKQPMERRIFPEGKDDRKRRRPTRTCAGRGSRTSSRREMFTIVAEHVFPFLRDARRRRHRRTRTHMKDARFTIPTPALLAKVVDLLDEVADGRSRHQGRPLRIHARQDRHAPGRTASSARRATSSR